MKASRYLYDAWLTIFFWPEDNMFTDSCGMPIYDIFDIITPNELYLFRKGIQFEFPLRSDPYIGVVIVDRDEDYYEWVDGEGIFTKERICYV